MDVNSDAFLWLKALHIIAVVCWFAHDGNRAGAGNAIGEEGINGL